MVIAGEDVLDAELHKIKPAGGDDAVNINSRRSRCFAKDNLPLPARGAYVAEALVVFTQKATPVLGDREAAVLCVTGEVDLDHGAGFVCARAADAYASRTAGRAGKINVNAPPRSFGHRFGCRAITIGGGVQHGGR